MKFEELLNEKPYDFSKEELIERIKLVLPSISKDTLLVTYTDLLYKACLNEQKK